MSDPDVRVSIEGDPDVVRIETGNPVVTIVAPGDLGSTTMISPEESSVIITDEHPEIHVNYDFSTDIGKTALLELLEDSLDVDQFSPTMAADIVLLRDLWIRVGDDIEQILIDADVDSINQIATTYTDTQIQTTAVEIARVDGDILANTSSITQTSTAINSRVDALVIDTDDNFTAQSARIDIHSGEIASSVTRMDNIDGDITQNQSDIIQTSDAITSEVAAREALEDGTVTENTTRSVQTATSLVDVITSNTNLNGRVDSAESRLTATEAVTTILTQEFDASKYSMQATESLTSNAYGVTITETTGGVPYVSGFELIVHPAWRVSTVGYDFNYAADNSVTYTDSKVYNCILDHVSTVDTSPGSAAWATYWELFDDTAQSAFNIQADSFSVITPGGLVPLLVVDGGTGAVSVNANLVVSGSIESANYGIAGESYYKLDHTTGSAEFNNITMSFTSGTAQDAFMLASGVTGEISQLQNQIDGNITSWFLTGVPSLINLPASDWTTDTLKDAHLGDLYYDDSTGYAYRFQVVATVYNWIQLSDSDISAALVVANSAQSTADGKIVSYYQTTAPTPEGVGDIWYDSDDNNTPYRWTGSAWQSAENPTIWANIGDPSGTKPSNNADQTNITNITAALINTPLIIADRISNHATASSATLDINFNTATITVSKATNGLIIAGGMQVTGGVVVSGTGALTVTSTNGVRINSNAGLQVNNGASIVVNSGGTVQVNNGSLVINGQSGSGSRVKLAYGGTTRSEIYCASTGHTAMHPVADNTTDLSIGTAYASWRNIEIESQTSLSLKNNGQVVALIAGLAVFTGLRQMAYACPTTYDYLIPSNGDFFFYANSDSGYVGQHLVRFREGGVCYTRHAFG